MITAMKYQATLMIDMVTEEGVERPEEKQVSQEACSGNLYFDHRLQLCRLFNLVPAQRFIFGCFWFQAINRMFGNFEIA